MSKTKLSTESQAEIIKDLPNICVLPRGDFLCDALGKEDHDHDQALKLNITFRGN